MPTPSLHTGTVLLVGFWSGFRCAQSTSASYLPMHTKPSHTPNQQHDLHQHPREPAKPTWLAECKPPHLPSTSYTVTLYVRRLVDVERRCKADAGVRTFTYRVPADMLRSIIQR